MGHHHSHCRRHCRRAATAAAAAPKGCEKGREKKAWCTDGVDMDAKKARSKVCEGDEGGGKWSKGGWSCV